jgi:putative hemolysin
MFAILVIFFIIFTGLSAMCSGSETGVYKISKVNLRINAEQGNRISIILKNMLDDSAAMIFSILIANNIFNYMATAIATYIFASRFESNAEYYAAIVTTPLLFVFGEVIPKNIFFIKPDTAMPLITIPLWGIHKMLCLLRITPMMKIIANALAKLFKMPTSGRSYANIRSTINIISDETRHEGLLSHVQWDIMNRMTSISNTTISSVMVPMDSVVMVNTDASRRDIIEILKKHPYTRILVYAANKQNIIGYINVFKTINCDRQTFKIADQIKQIEAFPSQMTVIEAIKEMNSRNIPIVVVTHKNHKIGIITIKDLAEELTGELSVC